MIKTKNTTFANKYERICELDTLTWLSAYKHDSYGVAFVGYRAFRRVLVSEFAEVFYLSPKHALLLYGWVWANFFDDIFLRNASFVLSRIPESVEDLLMYWAWDLIGTYREHIASGDRLVINLLDEFEIKYQLEVNTTGLDSGTLLFGQWVCDDGEQPCRNENPHTNGLG